MPKNAIPVPQHGAPGKITRIVNRLGYAAIMGVIGYSIWDIYNYPLRDCLQTFYATGGPIQKDRCIQKFKPRCYHYSIFIKKSNFWNRIPICGIEF